MHQTLKKLGTFNFAQDGLQNPNDPKNRKIEGAQFGTTPFLAWENFEVFAIFIHILDTIPLNVKISDKCY